MIDFTSSKLNLLMNFHRELMRCQISINFNIAAPPRTTRIKNGTIASKRCALLALNDISGNSAIEEPNSNQSSLLGSLYRPI